VPGAPRAQPQAARDPHRGHQAHGVPVAERLAQPGVGLGGLQPAGEHLVQQRPARDDHAGDRDAREDHRPAMRGQADERQADREHREVGDEAVGLDPALVGGDRPDRRDRAGHHEQREQPHRRPAPGRVAPTGNDQQRDHADDRRHQVEDDLDRGDVADLEAAAGADGDPGQRGPQQRRVDRLGLQRRDAQGQRPGRGAKRGGRRLRAHGGCARGWRTARRHRARSGRRGRSAASAASTPHAPGGRPAPPG